MIAKPSAIYCTLFVLVCPGFRTVKWTATYFLLSPRFCGQMGNLINYFGSAEPKLQNYRSISLCKIPQISSVWSDFFKASQTTQISNFLIENLSTKKPSRSLGLKIPKYSESSLHH